MASNYKEAIYLVDDNEDTPPIDYYKTNNEKIRDCCLTKRRINIAIALLAMLLILAGVAFVVTDNEGSSADKSNQNTGVTPESSPSTTPSPSTAPVSTSVDTLFPTTAPNAETTTTTVPLPSPFPSTLTVSPTVGPTLLPTTLPNSETLLPSPFPSVSPTVSTTLFPTRTTSSPSRATNVPTRSSNVFVHEETNSSITYVPGDLTVHENGLVLSRGLTSRRIATANESVVLENGRFSQQPFHSKPDGAAVFSDLSTGGWIYVSNCENENVTTGGVGALVFNANGNVIDYQWLLNGTTMNCGGGKTWWNTWLSCEEVSPGGQIYEVDPWGIRPPRITLLGGPDGSAHESVAYDHRNPNQPTFYITTDMPSGPLVRYTPDVAAVAYAQRYGDYTNLLHSNESTTARLDYLILEPTKTNTTNGTIDDKNHTNSNHNTTNNNDSNYNTTNNTDSNNSTTSEDDEDDDTKIMTGTFTWTPIRSKGRANAKKHFPQCEGIDARNGIVYFTCKKRKHLFELNLDQQTFTRSSTVSGAFDGSPDQVARILGKTDEQQDNDILYFCEDNGNRNGVHGRDATGKYYTILESDQSEFTGETSGLAFSPDHRHLYVSFQEAGIIFDVTRTDGHAFGGQKLDILYHNVEQEQR